MLLLDEPYVRPKLQGTLQQRDEHETYITPMTPLETGTRIYVFEVAHAHRLTSQRPMVTRRRGPGMIWYSLFLVERSTDVHRIFGLLRSGLRLVGSAGKVSKHSSFWVQSDFQWVQLI